MSDLDSSNERKVHLDLLNSRYLLSCLLETLQCVVLQSPGEPAASRTQAVQKTVSLPPAYRKLFSPSPTFSRAATR